MIGRRSFMTSVVTAASLPFAGSFEWPAALRAAIARKLALPTPDQTAWQNLEIGMFIHFAPNTWQSREYDNLSTPLAVINPVDLSTDQWAECAVNLGAKYILFVAKHVGGFCMWQTHTTNYGIRNTPWKGGRGDVMAEVSASCRRRGLKLGVYLSPRDDTFGAGTGGRCKTAAKQAAYNALYREQLTEVLSRYGPIVEVWFDGSIVVPVGDILKRYAPHAMVFQGPEATIRWVGNEKGFAPYPAWNAVSERAAKSGVATAAASSPNGSVWLPIEADVSILRPDWFWSASKERNLLTLNQLLEIYYRSVGHGVQLVLNLPPDSDGLMPEATANRAKQFGDEIRRRFGHSVAETSGSGNMLTSPLSPSHRIDHIILEEDCTLGQRIRAYRLEGKTYSGWKSLGAGTAIGHKHIQPVPPSIVSAVRLIVTESAGRPEIRKIALFDTGAQPPLTWNDANVAG